MERQRFLENVTCRLGRARTASTPVPLVAGPPESYVSDPLGATGGAIDRAGRFAQELALVGGKTVMASSIADARAALVAELEARRATRVVSWAVSELAGWGLDEAIAAGSFVCANPTADPHEDERFRKAALVADAGITAVDFAIAATGTLVLSAGPGRPRSVSLLPALHVALLRETQLVDRMGQAFIGLRRASPTVPSAVSFVTGPSRTSDIENDLSIGVHGPAAVSVILWRDAPRGRAAP